jgi:hypothetical protein
MNAELINYLALTVFGVLGYLMKRSITEQDLKIVELKQELHNTQSDLQDTKRNYLHKDDFKEFKQELRGMFEEIKSDIRSLRESA